MGKHDIVVEPRRTKKKFFAHTKKVASEQGSFIPYSCKPRRERRWTYVVAGFLLFLLGAGMSIVTLLFNEETIAAPLVTVETASSSLPLNLTYGPAPLLSDTNFFADTITAFTEAKQSFIEADLEKMKIRYHEEGVVVFESDILSKGKPGSWWETPAGLYAIQLKKKNHFSSFGQVYQPWSMAFQGNFFIHGWPKYPSGEAVPKGYSGGCIRLADTDAQAIYELVKVGTPVIVHEADYESDGFAYNIAPPEIDAKAFLIADIESGTVLAEKNSDTTLPIASITKLMTALVSAEYINLDKNVWVSKTAMATTSKVRLVPGMKLSAYSVLLPLLLESSNTAANLLAEQVGTTRFVSLMNDKAKALGMDQTTFVDPSGIGASNVSTGNDLLQLARFLFHNRSFVLHISSGEKVNTAYSVYNFDSLQNFNTTPSLTRFIGGKVGKTTAAGETALVFYEFTVSGETRTIVFALFGSKDRYSDIQTLHTYVRTHFADPS